MNYALKLFLIGLFALWSCRNEPKTSTEKTEVKKEEIKKDSCEGVSLLKVVEKAPFKNLKKFVLDSTFDFRLNEEKKITQKEFNCLKINKLLRKNFYYENGKQLFGPSDTIYYSNFNFFLYSVDYNKNGEIKSFTTYYPFGEGGAHSLNLFTVSPETQKIKDVYKIAFGMSDMGFTGNRNCKFLNDSIFIQNEYHFGQNELTKNIKEDVYKATSKFLITKTGEIKLLNHQVLINKEVK